MNDSLTSEEKLLVTKTFYQIVPISDRAAHKFYSVLFDRYPEVRPMFKSTEMGGQRKKLIDMIALVVYSLDNLDKVKGALNKLGERHSGYGVGKDDYAKVGEAFMAMLESELGSDYTEEVHNAWKKVYHLMSDMATTGVYE